MQRCPELSLADLGDEAPDTALFRERQDRNGCDAGGDASVSQAGQRARGKHEERRCLRGAIAIPGLLRGDDVRSRGQEGGSSQQDYSEDRRILHG
jgi:hypothetical protein